MELIDVKDLPAEALETRIMEDLVKDVLYAIKSNGGALVHECYGKVKAYRTLNVIGCDNCRKLSHVLASGWMNAGPEQRKAYAETVTEEDIRAGRNWRDKQA